MNPSQMVFLTQTSTVIDIGQSTGGLDWAKPDPFIDDEEEIILPDGGSVETDSGDVIIPDVPVDPSYDVDEAYY